jgi:Uncharacterized protein conserved in bacteria (DUF2314)
MRQQRRGEHSMHEPASNLNFYCPDHAPRPDPAVRTRPIASFIGRHVKVAFPDRTRSTRSEHLWVKVIGVRDQLLVGIIDNDPIFDIGYKDGDEVCIALDRIESVL